MCVCGKFIRINVYTFFIVYCFYFNIFIVFEGSETKFGMSKLSEANNLIIQAEKRFDIQ